MNLPLAFIGSLGPPEMLVVAFIALLLFGKRLPEVARSLGKGVTEFKKGIHGIEDEIEDRPAHRQLPHSADTTAPQAPKFEPPTTAQATEADQLKALDEVQKRQDNITD